MNCPKCPGSMRTYERNGVHVEQCDTCRGIFLDHGELEALGRAEAQWSGQQYAGPPQRHGNYGGGHHGGPSWGDRRQRKGGFGRFLFSS
ncbi:TFIIB-type zinc ribbon-containing protein [Kutzneria chonburiensis]|uniref:Zf-TFIIB domain-containing protein n=1 Tax=Kutzneria chonburiensis TaxID=1483604 RepID=A0ABV6MPF7_9PSEU|nr:zf-TFIIB domain-containing protein [Kutzneria chonburiensis]